jgi:uncharacterized protein
MSQPNVDVIEKIYADFSRGDIPGVIGAMDPQSELIYEGPSTIPWAGNRRGIEGWGKFFEAVGANLDGVALTTMEIFAAQGDNVVASGRYRATVKKTGKQIDSPLVHLWTVRNGKVVRCLEVTNTAAEAAAAQA